MRVIARISAVCFAIYVVLVRVTQSSVSHATKLCHSTQKHKKEVREMQDILPLFIAAEKPQWMSGPDFAVIVCLLSEATSEQPKTWLSQNTIAQRTGLSRSAVQYALETLKTEGWIATRTGKRLYNSNVYEVQYQNIPTTQPTVTAVSGEAQALAVIYRDLFLRYCSKYVNKSGRQCHRKLRSDWRKRWPRVIQNLLDAGNTEQFITQMFNWAVANRPKQFRAGPQGLIAQWPKREAK